METFCTLNLVLKNLKRDRVHIKFTEKQISHKEKHKVSKEEEEE